MNGKVFISFVIGLGAGAVGGYYISSQMVKKKLENDYAERLNSAREHLKSKYEARLNEDLKKKWTEEYKEKGKEDEKVEKPERTAKIPATEPEYEDVIQATDYSKFSKSMPKDIVVKDGPYIVDEDTYEDFLNIERYDLTYFKEDDVFMDSREVEWNDGLEKIGEDNLKDILNSDEETVWVINEDYAEGYAITVDEGSFSDYMAGN